MPGLFGASGAVMRVCRLPDPAPTHGYEPTGEAAMAAFAKSWRKTCELALDLVVPEREEATDRAMGAWYHPSIA
jgi:hypothetical protein